MPSGPHWLENALVLMLTFLLTSRPVSMLSPIVTSTPLPIASLLPATFTASYRLSAPSADRAVPGRIEPTTTIGLLVCTVSVRK
ncbi:hypothetical protein D3C86_682400 [compost metagenome]